MISKFFLIALFCVSLTQVKGESLEEAIKNGIAKVSGLYDEGQKKLSLGVQVVGYKSKAVEAKTLAFKLKSVVVEKGAKKAVQEVARDMEEKARVLNKTEAVFTCIRKNENTTNNKIENLTKQYQSNLKKLQNATLSKIETEAKPLGVMLEALKIQYQKVVKTIQACKTTTCVDNAVNGCAKWLEEMNAEVGKVLGQVGNTVGAFGKDCGDLFRAYVTQVNQAKSDGIREIKKCVFG